MKPFLFSTLLLTVVTLWMAAYPSDVLTDLRLTTEQVRNRVFYQLTTEHPTADLSGEMPQIDKQLSTGARASAVRAMGAVVRTYVQSADFWSRYDRWMRDQYRVSDEQTAEANRAENASMTDVQVVDDQQIAQTSVVFDQMSPAMMLEQQMGQLQQQMVEANTFEADVQTNVLIEK